MKIINTNLMRKLHSLIQLRIIQWMNQKLNNAHLLLISTYHDLVPTFNAMLKEENYNLKNFYLAVEKYGALDKDKRAKKLNLLVQK